MHLAAPFESKISNMCAVAASEYLFITHAVLPYFHVPCSCMHILAVENDFSRVIWSKAPSEFYAPYISMLSVYKSNGRNYLLRQHVWQHIKNVQKI